MGEALDFALGENADVIRYLTAWTMTVVVALVMALSASASSTAPPGASAQCRDKTYSYSHHRRGTCSHHGGVARWLRVLPP